MRGEKTVKLWKNLEYRKYMSNAHTKKKTRVKKDAVRESEISKELGCEFLRIDLGGIENENKV